MPYFAYSLNQLVCDFFPLKWQWFLKSAPLSIILKKKIKNKSLKAKKSIMPNPKGRRVRSVKLYSKLYAIEMLSSRISKR